MADKWAALKVFISYSRRDASFADQLVGALEARGFDVLIDRRDLPSLEDWERELSSLVRNADTVVFLVSPNSLASKVCAWEVDQVRLHGKRLAPVVIADIQESLVPADISRINYLFFTDPLRFDEKADELARALKTDTGWIKDHTRIGNQARRWTERGQPVDALLRGRELDDADAWAAQRPRDAPPLPAIVLEYLQVSKTHQNERAHNERQQIERTRRFQRRSAIGLAAVASLVCLGAVLAAFNYRQTSMREARVYTSLAQEAIQQGFSERAMKYALAGLPARGTIPLLTPWPHALEATLAGAAHRSRLRLVVNELVAFAADEKRLLSISDRKADVVDIETGATMASISIDARPHRFMFDPTGASVLLNNIIYHSSSGNLLTSVDGLIRQVHENLIVSISEFGDNRKEPEAVVQVHAFDTGRTIFTRTGKFQDAFASSSARLVTVGDDTVIWDLATGGEIARTTGRSMNLTGSGSKPRTEDGHFFIASNKNSSEIWDVRSATTFATIPVSTNDLHDVQISADGFRVLIRGYGDNEEWQLWDGRQGTQLARIDPKWSKAFFSPDGSRIAVRHFSDHAPHYGIFSAVDGSVVITGNHKPINDFAQQFTPRGDMFVVNLGASTLVFDATTGKERHTVNGHFVAASAADNTIVTITGGPAVRADTAADGNAVTISGGPAVRFHGRQRVRDVSLLPARRKELTAYPVHLSAHPVNIAQVLRISPQNSWVALDGYVWDAKPRERLILPHSKRKGEVLDVLFSPDGAYILTVTEKTSFIWDSVTGSKVSALTTWRTPMGSVFSSNNLIATGDKGHLIQLWNAQSGHLLSRLRGHKDTVTSMQFSPSGSVFASSSNDKTAIIWQIDNGAIAATLEHEHPVQALLFQGDNTLITATSTGVHRWERREEWQQTAVQNLPSVGGAQVDWGPKDFSVVGPGTFVWKANAKAWRRLAEDEDSWAQWFGPRQGFTSYYGRSVVSQESSRVVRSIVLFGTTHMSVAPLAELWDSSASNRIGILSRKSRRDQVIAASFNPSGKRVVTAGTGVQIWDAVSGAWIGSASGSISQTGEDDQEEETPSAVFDVSGSRVAYVARDNRVVVVDTEWLSVHTGVDLRDLVCKRLLVNSRAQSFENDEMLDPVLSGQEHARNPCDRSGPLTGTYWKALAHQFWSWLRPSMK